MSNCSWINKQLVNYSNLKLNSKISKYSSIGSDIIIEVISGGTIIISKNFISVKLIGLKVFLFVFLFLSFFPFKNQIAQTNEANFVHLLSENGLYQNTVHSILQDKKGFIWIATEDGLNKYDGYNFTVYKYNPQDSNSISDNFIWTIFEDSKGNLWVGTNSGGLCKFNESTETFTNYKNEIKDPNSISHNNIRAICEDGDGNLWVGTEGGGLNKFDINKKVFTRYLNDPQNPKSLSNNVVLSLF